MTYIHTYILGISYYLSVNQTKFTPEATSKGFAKNKFDSDWNIYNNTYCFYQANVCTANFPVKIQTDLRSQQSHAPLK